MTSVRKISLCLNGGASDLDYLLTSEMGFRVLPSCTSKDRRDVGESFV